MQIQYRKYHLETLFTFYRFIGFNVQKKCPPSETLIRVFTVSESNPI